MDMLELTGSLARFRAAYRDRTAAYRERTTMLAEAHADRTAVLRDALREAREVRRTVGRIEKQLPATTHALARLARAHSRLNDAVWVIKSRLQPHDEPTRRPAEPAEGADGFAEPDAGE